MVRYLECFYLFRSNSLIGFVTFLQWFPYIHIYICLYYINNTEYACRLSKWTLITTNEINGPT